MSGLHAGGCSGGIRCAPSLDVATMWAWPPGRRLPLDALSIQARATATLGAAALLPFGCQATASGPRPLLRAHPRPSESAGWNLRPVVLGGEGCSLGMQRARGCLPIPDRAQGVKFRPDAGREGAPYWWYGATEQRG